MAKTSCKMALRQMMDFLRADIRGMKSDYRCRSKTCQRDMKKAQSHLAKASRRLRAGDCERAVTFLRMAQTSYDYAWCPKG